MNIEINGLNINYETVGDGKEILLLHGWGSSLNAYSFIMNTFKDRYKLTAVDLPGFGKSDMLSSPWTVDDYCDFVLEFIKKINIKDPVYIGHSFGGRLIIKLSGLKRINPKKIILLDAAGIKHKKTIKQKVRQTTFKTVKKVLSVKLWKNACEPLMDKARNYFGSADYNNAPPVLRQTLVNTVNEDLTCYLDSIDASTLLIYGENDTATPVSDAEIMNSRIKDSGLCIIKNAGHFSFIDKPYEVNAILKSFLEA